MKTHPFMLTLALLWAISSPLVAQQAEPVHAVIVSGKDSTWYAQQAEAWELEIQKQPNSEDAWRNLFHAKYYLKHWYNGLKEESATENSVLKRMEQAIPESFTYNYCRYKISMAGESEFAERALTMIPDDADLGTVDGLLGYLWRTGADFDKGKRGEQFNDLLKRQYEAGFYPDFALRYNYNHLEGLPEKAIYIGIGDLDLFPKIMMQRVMNIHTDKFIIVSPFLFLPNYRNNICAHLGIPPYSPEKEHLLDGFSGFVQHLSEHTSRPIYINAAITQQHDFISETEFNDFCQHLYQEGLLLKYSTKPYDNKKAGLEALEKYHLEYLTEPHFRAENYWKGSERLQANYIVLLSNYIRDYEATGETTRAKRLKELLRASITNTQLDDVTKKLYLHHLETTCP